MFQLFFRVTLKDIFQDGQTKDMCHSQANGVERIMRYCFRHKETAVLSHMRENLLQPVLSCSLIVSGTFLNQNRRGNCVLSRYTPIYFKPANRFPYLKDVCIRSPSPLLCSCTHFLDNACSCYPQTMQESRLFFFL